MGARAGSGHRACGTETGKERKLASGSPRSTLAGRWGAPGGLTLPDPGVGGRAGGACGRRVAPRVPRNRKGVGATGQSPGSAKAKKAGFGCMRSSRDVSGLGSRRLGARPVPRASSRRGGPAGKPFSGKDKHMATRPPQCRSGGFGRGRASSCSRAGPTRAQGRAASSGKAAPPPMPASMGIELLPNSRSADTSPIRGKPEKLRPTGFFIQESVIVEVNINHYARTGTPGSPSTNDYWGRFHNFDEISVLGRHLSLAILGSLKDKGSWKGQHLP